MSQPINHLQAIDEVHRCTLIYLNIKSSADLPSNEVIEKTVYLLGNLPRYQHLNHYSIKLIIRRVRAI